MNKIVKLLLITLTCFTLQGCNRQINKQSGQTLIRSVAGKMILGPQFSSEEVQLVTPGIGELAGTLISGPITKRIDGYDKQMIETSSRQALEFSPSGNSVEWRNPDNGNSGVITPTKTFKKSGHYCREYIQEVTIGGTRQRAYGKACHQPDGNWKIIQ